MAGRAQAYPATLSGGETARAGLAVALALDAPLIVADEPTAEVDAATERMILDLLSERARRGKGALIATHSRAVEAIATRTLALRDGRLVAPETVNGSGFGAADVTASVHDARGRSGEAGRTLIEAPAPEPQLPARQCARPGRRRCRPDAAAGRPDRRHRPFGQRQVDAAQDARGHRAAFVGRAQVVRRDEHAGSPPTPHRCRFSGTEPHSVADGARERRAAATIRVVAVGKRIHARGRRLAAAVAVGPVGQAAGRALGRPDAAGSPLRERSSPNPRSSWPTNRRVSSTSRLAGR